jgi:hypothetical protein
LTNKPPYQLLHNSLPDIQFLKVFGCLCFASTLKNNRQKLDSRSRKCIHLGFKTGVKGHVLFDLHNKEVFLSRDVSFFENVFPYHEFSTHHTPHVSHDSNLNSPTYNHTDLDDLFLYSSPAPLPHLPSSTSTPHFNSPSISHNSPLNTSYNSPTLNSPHSSSNTSLPHPSPTPSPTSTNSPSLTPPLPITEPLRKSSRIPQPPSYLQDYHCNLLTTTFHESASSDHQSSSDSKYPLSSCLSYHQLSPAHTHTLPS